jgi:hypothetical protein
MPNKNKINPLRRVEFEIDDDDETTGVKTMSIVEDPAIGSNFIMMRKEKHFKHKMFVRLLLHAFEIGDFRLIDKARGKRSRDSFHRGLRLIQIEERC